MSIKPLPDIARFTHIDHRLGTLVVLPEQQVERNQLGFVAFESRLQVGAGKSQCLHDACCDRGDANALRITIGQKYLDRFRTHLVALCFRCVPAVCLALSALIRSSSFSAGSSFGSCGTSFPENARFRMDWRSF